MKDKVSVTLHDAKIKHHAGWSVFYDDLEISANGGSYKASYDSWSKTFVLKEDGWWSSKEIFKIIGAELMNVTIDRGIFIDDITLDFEVDYYTRYEAPCWYCNESVYSVSLPYGYGFYDYSYDASLGLMVGGLAALAAGMFIWDL